MKNGLAVGLIVGAIALGGGGGFAVNYMVNKPTVETYEQQVAQLQASLDAIGPLTTLYTVKANTTPGIEITADMLEEQSVPASFVGANALQSTVDIVGKYAKVGIAPGTPITSDLLMEDDINNEKELWHTVREYDVVVQWWPASGLKIGDYVDLNIIMPYGETYVVLSHMRIDGISDSTVQFKMTEAQYYLYQSALVDYYLNAEQGVRMTFFRYIEPGVQKPANVTYKVSEEIMRAMQKDSNLFATAWASVYDATTRSDIEGDLVATEDERDQDEAERTGIIAGGRDTWISSITSGSGSFTNNDKPEDKKEDEEGGIVW